ncbi:hypothetical protein B0J14DRAFT_600286 [Halenospora varia]|nr:hypothetical protein B0J14DRAFT_600286 [Halenospora varia]
MEKRPILIGNVSGSTGDRLDGLKQMLSGDTKIDAITGDWLSEFNLASRGLQKEENENGGFEPGFLYSLKLAVSEYISYPRKDLKVVVNAGGLNVRQLALEVQKVLASKGSVKKISYVTGDDIIDRVDELDVKPLTRSTGEFGPWKEEHGRILTANVYIGCWGIVRALEDGADIVICGRCTDASPVIGLAAWWHGWKQHDFDKLAGSLVAGHLIECGCYVCGGNFGGFQKMGSNYCNLSFPIAEISSDGAAVIQKQPNQNGMVTTDTTRTQFVYELQGIYYYNPDVIGDLTNVQMDHVGRDRVRISGARGLPAPATLKAAFMASAGYQSEFSVYITGLNAAAKAESFKQMSLRMLDRSQFQVLEFQVYGTPQENPRSQLESTLQLRVFAQAKTPTPLTRGRFLGPLLSNQLQGYPGLTPNLDYRTSDPKPYVTYFPGLVPVSSIHQRVYSLSGSPSTSSDSFVDVPNVTVLTPESQLPKEQESNATGHRPVDSFGQTIVIPLGDVVYARSGDKGANVNVGFFIPAGRDNNEKWEWLRSFMTRDRLIGLLGTDYTPGTYIDRCEFTHIQAVHFVIHGFLGAGVSSTSNMDALGKNLGEYLRAKHVPLPKKFLDSQKL